MRRKPRLMARGGGACTSICEIGVEIIYMGGGAPQDANSEVRLTLRSTGPIGNDPKCIEDGMPEVGERAAVVGQGLS